MTLFEHIRTPWNPMKYQYPSLTQINPMIFPGWTPDSHLSRKRRRRSWLDKKWENPVELRKRWHFMGKFHGKTRDFWTNRHAEIIVTVGMSENGVYPPIIVISQGKCWLTNIDQWIYGYSISDKPYPSTFLGYGIFHWIVIHGIVIFESKKTLGLRTGAKGSSHFSTAGNQPGYDRDMEKSLKNTWKNKLMLATLANNHGACWEQPQKPGPCFLWVCTWVKLTPATSGTQRKSIMSTAWICWRWFAVPRDLWTWYGWKWKIGCWLWVWPWPRPQQSEFHLQRIVVLLAVFQVKNPDLPRCIQRNVGDRPQIPRSCCWLVWFHNSLAALGWRSFHPWSSSLKFLQNQLDNLPSSACWFFIDLFWSQFSAAEDWVCQQHPQHLSARYFKLRIRDFPKDPNPNVRETRGIVGSHFG